MNTLYLKNDYAMSPPFSGKKVDSPWTHRALKVHSLLAQVKPKQSPEPYQTTQKNPQYLYCKGIKIEGIKLNRKPSIAR
jgi:hypothetical protein